VAGNEGGQIKLRWRIVPYSYSSINSDKGATALEFLGTGESLASDTLHVSALSGGLVRFWKVHGVSRTKVCPDFWVSFSCGSGLLTTSIIPHCTALVRTERN